MSRPASPSPVEVKALDNCRLWLRFDNGEEGIFNAAPYFSHDYFAALRVPAFFRTVTVNPLTVEWPGGIDICPDELYEGSRPFRNGGAPTLTSA